jgi:nitroreductase
MKEKTVSEAIEYRRSVRKYDASKPVDSNIVRKCLEQAVLAPNSSNMQLWEFKHVTSASTLKQLVPLCFNQNAAKTAQQMIVVVVRKDLWRKRAKANLDYVNQQFPPKPKSEQSNREKIARNYYGRIIPLVYNDLLSWSRYLTMIFTGFFRPIYREVLKQDMRVVAHKSAALAAQTFMLSMAAAGYDTCPMEGIDSWRVKKVLGLPKGAQINMIISCGIRIPEGLYGERFRIPFEEVYKEV